MLEQEILDELWDFDEPARSEERFRIELEQGGPYDDVERAELMTQLARSIGLQERYPEAADVLAEAESVDAPVVAARILLEGGRLANSAGDARDAVPLLRRAAEIARDAHHDFLEVDALHMLAIASPEDAADWTGRAVDVAEASTNPRTQRWLVSLHNNLGWNRFDGGDFDAALAEFTEAARWADLVGTEQQRQWAQEAIAECSAAMQSDEP